MTIPGVFFTPIFSANDVSRSTNARCVSESRARLKRSRVEAHFAGYAFQIGSFQFLLVGKELVVHRPEPPRCPFCANASCAAWWASLACFVKVVGAMAPHHLELAGKLRFQLLERFVDAHAERALEVGEDVHDQRCVRGGPRNGAPSGTGSAFFFSGAAGSLPFAMSAA